jgi:LmbE family N-acetylglucosaminyl deacetylase
MSEEQGYDSREIKIRKKEIESVARIYDFVKTHNLNLPTTKLDTIPMGEIIRKLGELFNEIKPATIYLPNRSDVHSDHRIAFEAAWSCCKTFRYSFIQRVFMYETLSETDFVPPFPESAFLPNSFSNISSYLEKKVEIMSHYNNEMKDHPFPRSEKNIRALATLRGGAVGVHYAEAFMLLKEVH